MACPSCKGLDNGHPRGDVRLKLGDGSLPDWALCKQPPKGTKPTFTAEHTVEAVGAYYEGPGHHFGWHFKQGRTLMAGDTLELNGPWACDHCGGDGTFEAFARRRMRGEAPGGSEA